ncbi:MAG: hypothetical protein IPL08_21000 [Saprospiraceae bacterium]|nr:hypothetical protein [Saprospiraceae bacterium]MBK8671109.1 hypothetical protein [Saprospiraceae bacterium]
MKQIFGILTSLVTAVLIIIMAQMIREGLYPLPVGFDYTNRENLLQYMNNLPNQAYIIITVSHAIAAFAAGLISSLVSDYSRITTGIIAWSIVFIFVMVYLFTYEFPTWFVITDTLVTGVVGFLGAIIGSARYVS